MHSIRAALSRSLHAVKSTSKASSRLSVASRRPALPLRTYLFTSQLRPVTTSASTMSAKVSANIVLDQIKNRRTYYPLSRDLTIGKDRIQEIVKEALQHTPSSFNSQSNRVVVLFDGEHDKLWRIVEEVLRGIVPPENWENTGKKLGFFKGAAGTIMFFEDQTVVEGMQQKFPLYADHFPVWATQSDAMLQFVLWTALEAEGLGANLQHYNPIINDRVAAEWKIPATWKLNAQLVFGGRTAEAGDKQFQPLEEKYKVFGA